MQHINEIHSKIEELFQLYKDDNNGETPSAFYIQTDILSQIIRYNIRPLDWNKPFIGHPWYLGVLVYPVVRPDTTFTFGFYDQGQVEAKRIDPSYRVTRLNIPSIEFDVLTDEYPETNHVEVEIPDAVLRPNLGRNRN